jgi:hypothetical protein
MGKCVVVKAENGRVAAAYNGDGFASVEVHPTSMGFVRHCGGRRVWQVFHRTDTEVNLGIFPGFGGPCVWWKEDLGTSRYQRI